MPEGFSVHSWPAGSQELWAPNESPEIKASPGQPLTLAAPSEPCNFLAGWVCSLVALTTRGRNLGNVCSGLCASESWSNTHQLGFLPCNHLP